MDYLLVLLGSGPDVQAEATQYAVLRGDPDILSVMKKHGFRINWDCPVLNLAILKGDVNMLKKMLAAGAKVDSSRSMIGSPLHVACTDGITNRKEIIQILLESGADPNLKVYNDEGGAELPPALSDYLTSNRNPSAEIVALLLRYGAKVIMKSRVRDPAGILNNLQNLASEEYQHIFNLLLEAAESFDLSLMRTNAVTASQKEALILRASTPISLLAQSRICLKRYYKKNLVDVVQHNELPEILQQYLLFNLC